VAALETAAFLVLAFRAFRRRPPRETWQTVVGSPPLAFCVVFCAVFGVGVGLMTTNLGALSRYRMPLIPFFVVLLLVLEAPFPALRPVIVAAPPKGPQTRRRPAGILAGKWGSSQRS
jgi:hypothetical protein